MLAVQRLVDHFVWFSGASSKATNSPRVGESLHFGVGHVEATARGQIVAPNVVVVATQATKFILVVHWNLHLKKEKMGKILGLFFKQKVF